MQPTTLIAILSALATGHALFLAAYLWSYAEGRRLPNRLLAALLLALAVRIGKSVIITLFPESSEAWPAIALVGLFGIGPALWLYSRAATSSLFRWKAACYLHFLPSGLLAVVIPWMPDAFFFWAYALGNSHLLAYWLLSIRNTRGTAVAAITARWLFWLHLAFLPILLVFILQLFINSMSIYVAVTALAAATLYALSFLALRWRSALHPPSGTLLSDDPELLRLGRRIQRVFEEQKLYTDPNLTVAKLAAHLQEQAYLVSKAVNLHFGKTFPELLHAYRIREAERLLQSPDAHHLSIEAIAYDSGFNSLSAFYAAFKKIKQTTPAEFRNANGIS
ncbi:MAG: helix-turn-helix transcriptional regulator [Phaeodactylibacter sp.]|nr:helix-turn-helix transcriptional regulator [Phaeodactylibacter sp.]MCB9297526.1 helix-turn-helix transcriptional regulator [Lewinellaceae bacterium]